MLRRPETFPELLERLGEWDFDDYGTFLITKIEGNGDDFEIMCQIVIDGENRLEGAWSIVCNGVRKSSVRLGYFGRVFLDTNHVLLAEFSEPTLRLGFRGKVIDTTSAIGELYNNHIEIAENWIPLSAYLMGRKMYDLIEGGFGTLAEGPSSFIEIYDRVLRAHGVETTITGEIPPTEWNGKNFHQFPKLSVLILDDCYVVAESFVGKEI